MVRLCPLQTSFNTWWSSGTSLGDSSLKNRSFQLVTAPLSPVMAPLQPMAAPIRPAAVAPSRQWRRPSRQWRRPSRQWRRPSRRCPLTALNFIKLFKFDEIDWLQTDAPARQSAAAAARGGRTDLLSGSMPCESHLNSVPRPGSGPWPPRDVRLVSLHWRAAAGLARLVCGRGRQSPFINTVSVLLCWYLYILFFPSLMALPKYLPNTNTNNSVF